MHGEKYGMGVNCGLRQSVRVSEQVFVLMCILGMQMGSVCNMLCEICWVLFLSGK